MDRTALHKLLAFGLERGASDIHFEAGYPPHYRLNGELMSAHKVPPLTAADTEAIARMILEDRADRGPAVDFARPFAELDVAYALAQRGRFRATIFRQRGAAGVVMRLIPIHVPSLEELLLPRAVAQLAELRSGLVLIAGPAGKTTAMAAMVRHVNETRHAHVITIEDPIEYLHEPRRCLIIQRELGTDTQSFHGAIAAALRQDPDVIALGELRDAPTASAALQAAQTGHLVIAALPALDVVSALQHVLGLFEREAQPAVRERLGRALQAVVSLRLLPGLPGGAGLPVREDKRRVPAVEILRATPAVREHVRGGRLAELPAVMREERAPGVMQLLDQHLQELVERGLVTRETALEAATSPADLERALRAAD
jgi:twitching motility protein PilT